ncbi:MAG TPA: hypothetical protein VFY72_12145, partial [Beijerinckiaceae bacterium]|nr:hypothetical protein [Beijerinckiaceae bacterium]
AAETNGRSRSAALADLQHLHFGRICPERPMADPLERAEQALRFPPRRLFVGCLHVDAALANPVIMTGRIRNAFEEPHTELEHISILPFVLVVR